MEESRRRDTKPNSEKQFFINIAPTTVFSLYDIHIYECWMVLEVVVGLD